MINSGFAINIIGIISIAVFSYGIYCILTGAIPGVHLPAVKALSRRAPKKLTQTEIAINRLSEWILPYLELDAIKRFQLDETLKTLGHTQSPEEFTARAAAKGIVYSALLLWLVIFSVPIGLTAVFAAGIAIYNQEKKKLKEALEEHRHMIERELPQFASTIRQSLNTTHDIVTILSNYRKICGEALAGEIDKTLNDIMTGNAQKAIKSLEARVSSAKLAQLTRGLQAVLRGDDQRVYFDMLAGEYRRSQDEEVERILQERPKQLNPYMAVLFICLALMIAASVGADIAAQMNSFF